MVFAVLCKRDTNTTDRLSLDEATHRYYDFISILDSRLICLKDCTKLKTKIFMETKVIGPNSSE